MSSTYSPNLALELTGTGEQAGNWGATNNLNIGTLLEQAISGYVTQSVATGTDTTLTMSNGASATARNMFIELTGTGGASTNLIVPNNKKLYFIYNHTSAGQVTVKVSGQTGVSVPNGNKLLLVSNGTDIVNAVSYITSVDTVTYATYATQIQNTGGWNVTPSGSKLYFNYNGTNVGSLDSSGNLIITGAITTGGTP